MRWHQLPAPTFTRLAQELEQRAFAQGRVIDGDTITDACIYRSTQYLLLKVKGEPVTITNHDANVVWHPPLRFIIE